MKYLKMFEQIVDEYDSDGNDIKVSYPTIEKKYKDYNGNTIDVVIEGKSKGHSTFTTFDGDTMSISLRPYSLFYNRGFKELEDSNILDVIINEFTSVNNQILDIPISNKINDIKDNDDSVSRKYNQMKTKIDTYKKAITSNFLLSTFKEKLY